MSADKFKENELIPFVFEGLTMFLKFDKRLGSISAAPSAVFREEVSSGGERGFISRTAAGNRA